MNYKSVFYVLGKIMNILGLLMLLPLFVSFYYNMQGFEEAKYSSFIIPILLLFALGMLSKLFKPSSVKIYAREGLSLPQFFVPSYLWRRPHVWQVCSYMQCRNLQSVLFCCYVR